MLEEVKRNRAHWPSPWSLSGAVNSPLPAPGRERLPGRPGGCGAEHVAGAPVSGFLWLSSPGAVMEEEAAKLLGVKMCKFIPRHTRTLGNEFRCYVNYDSGLDRELWTQLVIQCSKGPMWHFPLFIFLVDWKATTSPPPSQTGALPGLTFKMKKTTSCCDFLSEGIPRAWDAFANLNQWNYIWKKS